MLTLELDPNSRIVRATETWEILFSRRRRELTILTVASRPAEGWGMVTPEGNLFLVDENVQHMCTTYLTVLK